MIAFAERGVASADREILVDVDSERAWIPQPSERHREFLGALVAAPGIKAILVHDAHRAALAIERGLILCSTDSDFARFPELRWENPLLAGKSAGE